MGRAPGTCAMEGCRDTGVDTGVGRVDSSGPTETTQEGVSKWYILEEVHVVNRMPSGNCLVLLCIQISVITPNQEESRREYIASRCFDLGP